jgi:hypothetical protein
VVYAFGVYLTFKRSRLASPPAHHYTCSFVYRNGVETNLRLPAPETQLNIGESL